MKLGEFFRIENSLMCSCIHNIIEVRPIIIKLESLLFQLRFHPFSIQYSAQVERDGTLLPQTVNLFTKSMKALPHLEKLSYMRRGKILYNIYRSIFLHVIQVNRYNFFLLVPCLVKTRRRRCARSSECWRYKFSLNSQQTNFPYFSARITTLSLLLQFALAVEPLKFMRLSPGHHSQFPSQLH